MTKPDSKRDTINIDLDQDAYELHQEPGTMPEGADEDPSWFARTYPGPDSGELVRRYRERLETEHLQRDAAAAAQARYRARIEERFQQAKRMAERERDLVGSTQPGHEQPPTRKPIASRANEEPQNRYVFWEEKVKAKSADDAPKAKARARKPRVSKSKIVTGFAVACLVGGSLGFVSAHPGLVSSVWTNTSLSAQSAYAALSAMPQMGTSEVDEAVTVPATILTKKSIKTARVEVADVSGALNNPIPLALSAIPASPDQPIALRITGVPAKAYLTQGTKVSEGQWIVKPQEIDGVGIVVPNSDTAQIDLSIIPVEEKTGAPAAPTQSMTVALDQGDLKVVPVSAAPEGSEQPPLPGAIPPPETAISNEAQGLMTKGDALLKTGDLISARQFYLRAHDKGLVEAAFGIGQTYDPLLYKSLNVRGLQPDKAKAEEWYGKAAEAGSAAASAALAKLAAQSN